MPVVVVTDSSACLPSEVADELGIVVVPLHILVGGAQLREGVDPLPDNVYGSDAGTSAPSPGELVDVFRAASDLSNGDGVVAIHLSRKISATWEAARRAAYDLGERVRIVDSQTTAMGLGFVVLDAVAKAHAGGSIDDVYDAAVESSSRQHCFVLVNSLDQLRRGGRIGTATALLGTALSMKPLLQIVDGKLVLKEKTRTASKAQARLIEEVVKVAEGRRVRVAVHHVEALERAQLIAAELSDVLEISEISVSALGAILGIHVGEGAIGVIVGLEPVADAAP